MSKKVYNLVVGIIGGVSTIAVAVVTFIAPHTQLLSMQVSALHPLPPLRFADSL